MPTPTPAAKHHALESQVRRTIRRFAMIAPGSHVLVAVSGGADSTALLLCLHALAPEYRLSLTVAHLNHRIRGEEGDADAEFVRRMAAELSLQFVADIIEVKQQAEASKQNLEELARRRRYEFLRRTAARVGATRIAVGHTLNDQSETALYRFMRGSGMEGLSAIHPVVDQLIIRPLLDCSRTQICDYLQHKGALYREDSTNADLLHARNRIRHELIPYIQKNFNPQLLPTIAHETLLVREAWDYVQSQAAEAYATMHSRAQNGIVLEIPKLLALHPALQKLALRSGLKECLGTLQGIGYVHIQNLLALCETGGSGDILCVPHGGAAVRQFDSLLLLKNPPEPVPAYACILNIPGRCHIVQSGHIFQCARCSPPNSEELRHNHPERAYLSMETLPASLTVRSRIPGDRYGGSGHRKVKKMLIDGKVPLLQRAALPMVAAGNDVVWIPGFPPARRYAANPDSKSCVLVEMLRA